MGTEQIFEGLSQMIGNTPLLEISYTYNGKAARVFAKTEYYNLTGSIKDRVAFHVLKKAYREKTIKPSDIIAEATSGNTGISFSALGAALGHKVIIYMPDWMSRERITLMESYGAEVRLVSREEGGFLGSIAMTEKLYEKGGVFLPRQFSNPDNSETHELFTGPETVAQLEKLGLKPDAVIAGVGTGGTVMGLSRAFKKANPSCLSFPLEPENSPTLSTGYKVGKHRIQGISDEFIPDLLKLSELESVISVDDADSIVAARDFAKTFGIGVGISSGANFLGAVLVRERLEASGMKDPAVVTVFADDSKKYLSTDYSTPPAVTGQMISSKISLTGVKTVR